MRRRKKYVSRGYAKRRKRRVFFALLLLLIVGICLLFVFPASREAIASLPPLVWVQNTWKNWRSTKKEAAIPSESPASAAPASTAQSPETVSVSSAGGARLGEEEQTLLDLKAAYSLEIQPTLESGALHFDLAQKIVFSNMGEGPMSEILLYVPGEMPEISRLLFNGENALSSMTERSDHFLRISLEEPIAAKETAEITLLFTGLLPETNQLPGYNGRSAFFADFYPLLASYDGHAWLADLSMQGGNRASFTVNISSLGEEYNLALGAEQQGEDETSYRAEGLSSVAFATGLKMRTGRIEAGNSKLSFYLYHTSEVNVWTEMAQPAFVYLQGLLGDYAYEIPVFEGSLESGCEAKGGMIFVDSTWVARATTSKQRTLISQMASIYLEAVAKEDLWLCELLARYLGQSYELDYQSVVASASGTASDSAEVEGPAVNTAGLEEQTLPEGLDADVYTLMGLRNSVGAESFDAALKLYVQSAGAKAFADCFESDKQTMVRNWLAYYRG